MEHGCTSSTDVTGFGILGHAENLAEIQFENVDYVIDTLPCYRNLVQLDGIVRNFNIRGGRTPETSGGLLISFPRNKVGGFIKALADRGEEAWIIGRVVAGERKGRMSDNLEIFDI